MKKWILLIVELTLFVQLLLLLLLLLLFRILHVSKWLLSCVIANVGVVRRWLRWSYQLHLLNAQVEIIRTTLNILFVAINLRCSWAFAYPSNLLLPYLGWVLRFISLMERGEVKKQYLKRKKSMDKYIYEACQKRQHKQHLARKYQFNSKTRIN